MPPAVDEEEAFPRRRLSAQVANDVLQNNKKKKRALTFDRGTKVAVDDDDEGEAPKKRSKYDDVDVSAGGVPGTDVESIEHLKSFQFMEGLLMVGAVHTVTDQELCLDLPFHTMGFVSRSEATEPDSASGPLPGLTEIYKPGQLVMAVISSVLTSVRTQLRVEMSMRPALMNAGLHAESVTPGMWLPAVVQDEQEHVFRLAFGIKNLQGLLKKSEAKKLPYLLVPGLIINVGILSAPSKGTVMCSASQVGKIGQDSELSVETLKAGFLVDATVNKIFSRDEETGKKKKGNLGSGDGGLMMKICGAVVARVHWHHHQKIYDEGEEIKVWEKKEQVEARVIAVVPSMPPVIHLSLLPHLVSWKSCEKDVTRHASIGERLPIKVVDKVEKFSVRVLCNPGVEGVLPGYVPFRRLADKGVEVMAPAEGSELEARVIAYDYLENRVVLTRRPYDMRPETLVSSAELQPGQLVVGEVSSITEFGMFVSLSEYIRGLVSIRHVADVPLAAVPPRFKVGTRVKCRVLNVKKNGSFELTAKKTLVNEEFQLCKFDEVRKDMIVTGTVKRVGDYGHLVQFYGNVTGLISTGEFKEGEAAPAVGMLAKVRIKSVNNKRKLINLTMDLEGGKTPRELLDGTHLLDNTAFPPGMSVSITGLLDATETGIVVTIRSTKDKTAESKGFIPSVHLADDLEFAESLFQEIKAGSQAGKEVPLPPVGVVLSTETDKQGASEDSGPYMMLSAKPLLLLAEEDGAFVTALNSLKEGGHYSGYVTRIFDFGAMVSVGMWGCKGLLPRSFVCGPTEKVEDLLKVGQTLRVQVSRINLDESKFQVDLCRSSDDKPVLRREVEALRRMFVDRKAHQARAEKKQPAAWKTLTPGAVVEGTVGNVDADGTVTLSLKGYKGITAVVTKDNVPEGQTLSQDQAVRCAVLDFDSDTGLVDVSLQAELVEAAGKSAPSNKRRKKAAAAAEGEEANAEPQEGQEFKALLALRKPGYAVLWTKEPPNVLYAPPFGDAGPKGRRGHPWTKPMPVFYHAKEGDRLLTSCPVGREKGMKVAVPKITELKVGSTISVAMRKVSNATVSGYAPPSVCGRLHATQCLEVPPEEEMKIGAYLGNPLESMQHDDVLTGRVITLSEEQKTTDEHQQVTIAQLSQRQSVIDLPPDAEMDATVIPRWDTLEVGQKVMGAISEIRKKFMYFEVAKEVKGILRVVNATSDPDVLKDPAAHFKPGQIYIASVVKMEKEKKKMSFTLMEKKEEAPPSKKDEVVKVKLVQLTNVAGKGAAAVFRLPNNKLASAHITELFDFWDPFPQRKLSTKKVYQAKVLKEIVNSKHKEDAHITLRASQVFGKKEGQSEKRPEKVEDLQVNQMVSGYVTGTGPKGVFVALSPTVTGWIGLLSLREKVDDPNKIADIHKIGELIQDARVYRVIPEQQRLMLTLRDDYQITKGSQVGLDQLSVGDNVSCFVMAVEKYGIKVRVDNSAVRGLIYKTDVSDNKSVTMDSFKRGMKIKKVKIIKIDEETGRVDFGIKASLFEGDPPEEEEEEDDDDMDDDAKEEPAPAVAEEKPEAAAEAASEGQEAAEKGKKGKKRKASAAAVEIEAAAKADDAAGEAAPWDLAAAATLTGLDNKNDAFDWPDFKVAGNDASEDEDEEDVGEALEEGKNKKLNKRERKAMRLEQAKELQQKEEEQAEGAWAKNPTSVEDFERLLLSQGNTSIVWIRYMAFHLKLSDLERARQVAERAVKHVGFSDAKERFNTWVAFMNLECTFGTEATADAIFKRASSHNPAKQVHLQLARIHERNRKPLLATKVYESAAKKFGHSKKVWLAFLAFLYQQGDLEGGRKTLPKAIAALPKRKHPLVVSKAALLEYTYGTPERGRSVFEGLLDSYPKRTDLWSAYIDAHIRANTPPKVAEPGLKAVRSLLEKCCTMRLKAVKMRFFFKRWLDFEKRWGDAESQESVRARARDFVESQGS